MGVRPPPIPRVPHFARVPATIPPVPGQLVLARSRQYLVDEVSDPQHSGGTTRVRLSCVDDDNLGAPLEVLWEHELDAQVAGEPVWQHARERGFDSPARFSAYLHALRWNAVTATDPKLFQAPYRAGIEVMAYQLEPLRKALLLPRVNLFIADDVGLGKTIEAGLILQELIYRQKVRRVVVAAPPSVVLQWRDELDARFGLTFVVLDRAYVAARRRERGFGVNPWTTHSRFIVSHALLRDETYAAGLRDWLGDFAPGSLLILDEAHNAAPASGAKYAIDSHLTRAVRDLAPRFEHRLFLSATPHNGHSNSFAALLELLDPQRFCRGVPVKASKVLEPVMVRRLKEDLRALTTRLPERRIVQHDIDGLPLDAPELQLAELLAELKMLRADRLRDAPRSVQTAAGLVLVSLQKRLLSSVEAFACTLAVHRRALARQLERAEREEPTAPPAGQAPVSPRALGLLAEAPGADDEAGTLDDDALRAAEAAQVERATAASGSVPDERARALVQLELVHVDEMQRVADAARGRPDPRVRLLLDWVREHQCPGLPRAGDPVPDTPPTWTARRAVIFTEYVDTKRWLEQQLRAALADTDRADERIASFTGGMGDEAREAVKAAFNADPERDPLRILIATDAAREGVNLQNHCADLFHFDVPWNPSRMEQRNGRIDRKLQREPIVRCHYFVFTQRAEDRVLQVLVEKTRTIARELGSLSPVLDRKLEAALQGGIDRSAEETLKRRIRDTGPDPVARAAVDEELDAVTRTQRADLARQLDTLRTLLDASRAHLDLREATFREALDCALALNGAEGLAPVHARTGAEHTGNAAGAAPRWRFPALDRRAGADATWADTLDALRTPRRPDQKPWAWRAESPIRPVVFADTGTLDGDAVHLHLEHRVVKRLLGRFLAQGFVHDDLSRACVGQSRDAVPRVILLGRLSLYGPGAARLHDEIIAVAARWTDPAARTAPLRPYGDEAEERALELLESTLGDPSLHTVSAAVRDRLLAGVAGDVDDLRPHLERRGHLLAARAGEKLRARADKEAREMADVLIQQRESILKTQRRYLSPQLALDFDVDERRQLESDRRHWERRLAKLVEEVEREPARVREGYAVRVTRIDPVGVAYLWPVTG